jgi:hypothetical protein
MATQIFVSYRREDTADITGRICDRLQQKYGEPAVFKDVDSIPPGRDFRKYLDSKIKECAVVLVVVGADWMKEDSKTGAMRLDNPHDFVRIEIESALKRGIPVIPLLVEGASLPPEARLPEGMRDFVYRQARVIGHDPNFRLHMEVLIGDLERIFDECQAAARPQKPYTQPTAPIRPTFQRPTNSAPLPRLPAPPPTARGGPYPVGARPPQNTSSATKVVAVILVLSVIFIFFMLLIAGLANASHH